MTNSIKQETSTPTRKLNQAIQKLHLEIESLNPPIMDLEKPKETSVPNASEKTNAKPMELNTK